MLAEGVDNAGLCGVLNGRTLGLSRLYITIGVSNGSHVKPYVQTLKRSPSALLFFVLSQKKPSFETHMNEEDEVKTIWQKIWVTALRLTPAM